MWAAETFNGEVCKNLYNQSGRDTKHAIFLNANFCPKLMRFIQIYRVWVYLSIVVGLPHFCKVFFYQMSTSHCPCLTA